MKTRNPYLPSWEYVPDGEPHVFDGRVYVYGSHDRFNGCVFCLGDYVCWSAPIDDLGDWRYEGVIYEKTSDPYNRDGSMCLYAPDVTRGPDGRYYISTMYSTTCPLCPWPYATSPRGNTNFWDMCIILTGPFSETVRVTSRSPIRVC